MTKAKNGDRVKVHYTGKLDDGRVFDSSVKREPIEFIIGKGQVIPGFEKAVEGMNPGESKTTKVPPEKAYGPRREEMIVEVEREKIPAQLDPKVGQRLQLQQPDGRVIRVTVTDVSESSVTLDANHPLAGKELTFDIQLVEIV
ncbi:MAG: peptidylprolyl isomerase [candidate division Zixibacteria bacterium SM23_73_2]|nr:MAG: peptidylprolyl isomerase [candidate division Zixibacteria bacterium SM23_73_2]